METPADRLRKARIARGFRSPTEAARHFGWSEVTYRAHESGTRGLRIETAKRYAKAFRIPLGELLGTGASGSVATENVPVVGSAAWGVWLDMAIAETQTQDEVPLPLLQDEDAPKRAIRIADESVDKMIPKGYFAIYREIAPERIADLPIGRLVVVKRRHGGLVERTIRMVAKHTNDSVVLVPNSNDKRYAGSLSISYEKMTDAATIVGEVVGIYGELS